MTDLVVAPCDHAAAKYAIENWHYSGTCPNQKLYKLGVWENGDFIGAVIFGDGANPGLFKPYGLTQMQGCELVRVALTAHQSHVSQIVAAALACCEQANPGLRIVLSFADPEHGHVGGIYQAGNWLYLGRTDAFDEYLVNGRRMHGRALRSTRATHRLGGLEATNVYEWAKTVLDPGIKRVPGSTKHRYAYPLDRAMRRQLRPLALPYPKSADEGSKVSRPTSGGEGQVRSLASAQGEDV